MKRQLKLAQMSTAGLLEQATEQEAKRTKASLSMYITKAVLQQRQDTIECAVIDIYMMGQ